MFLLLWSWVGAGAGQAGGQEVTVYLFTARGCLHCLKAKNFLSRLPAEDPAVRVVELELTQNRAYQEIFREVATRLRVESLVVPLLVVGDLSLLGWYNDEVSGAALRQIIATVRHQNRPDIVAPLLLQATSPGAGTRPWPEKLTLPFLGELELRHLSLGLLTLILGALDGFNPCAMWALVFLIGLLINLEERRRVWLLGSLFIAGSGLVYYLFMAAWLNILLLLGFIVWIRIGIGLVALVAGGLNLRQYFRRQPPACPLGDARRQGLLARLKQAVTHHRLWLAALGVFLLGLAVNLVELFCSAGLPVIYTQILTLHRLPSWQYYAYLALYVFIFMLDDLIVFVASMLTLQYLHFGDRYRQFSNLVGGVVLVMLGLLLILKPEVLTLGAFL